MWTVLWASGAIVLLWLVLVDPSKEAVQNLVFWIVCVIALLVYFVKNSHTRL